MHLAPTGRGADRCTDRPPHQRCRTATPPPARGASASRSPFPPCPRRRHRGLRGIPTRAARLGRHSPPTRRFAGSPIRSHQRPTPLAVVPAKTLPFVSLVLTRRP